MPHASPRRDHGSAKSHRPSTARDDLTVSVELTQTQIGQVMRAVRKNAEPLTALAMLPEGGLEKVAQLVRRSDVQHLDDRRMSQSLLKGLLVLACFPEDGSLGIKQIADALDMSMSTTHRYVTTLKAIGLLKRDGDSRRYSRWREHERQETKSSL